jgi:hypothetical protein
VLETKNNRPPLSRGLFLDLVPSRGIDPGVDGRDFLGQVRELLHHLGLALRGVTRRVLVSGGDLHLHDFQGHPKKLGTEAASFVGVSVVAGNAVGQVEGLASRGLRQRLLRKEGEGPRKGPRHQNFHY